MDAEPDINMFRPDRPGIRKVLGDLEAEIMEFMWSRPPGQGVTVRDVLEALYQRRRMAYTTVMTTMARLARKNLLRAERAEQAYVYYPALTEKEFVSHFVGRIVEDLLVSFTGATVESLKASLTPQTARRIQELLDEVARRRTELKEEGG